MVSGSEDEDKQGVRAELLQRRRAMEPQLRTDLSRQIRDHVLARVTDEMSIAAYVSLGSEPETLALLEELVHRGCRVLLPVLLADNDLDWAPYRSPDSLRTGAGGIREPNTPPLGVAAIGDVDLALIPALAVSTTGVRLGRGGGSYDRALARRSTDAPTVAICFAHEVVASLPDERHDQRVNAVVTPAGWQGVP